MLKEHSLREQEISYSLSRKIWNELIIRLSQNPQLVRIPQVMFADAEKNLPSVVDLVSQIIEDSDYSGTAFACALAHDSSIFIDDKEKIVEVLFSILKEEIQKYQRLIPAEGAHSVLGKAYRKQIQRYEKAATMLLDENLFLNSFNERLEVLIRLLKKNKPHLLDIDVINLIIEHGKNDHDARDFTEAFVLGTVNMLHRNRKIDSDEGGVSE